MKRFQKLWRAARDDAPAPPIDLRYLQRPRGRIGAESEVRSDIHSFLSDIYDSVAETLPDFRDELCNSSKFVQMTLDDPYSQALHVQLPDSEFLPDKEKKPRKRKGQVEINLERTSKQFEERWLPPGSMKEYFEQYRNQSALEKPGSFASFWRVSCRAIDSVSASLMRSLYETITTMILSLRR